MVPGSQQSCAGLISRIAISKLITDYVRLHRLELCIKGVHHIMIALHCIAEEPPAADDVISARSCESSDEFASITIQSEQHASAD